MPGLITQPVKKAQLNETSDPALTENNQFFRSLGTLEKFTQRFLSFIVKQTKKEGFGNMR